MGERKVSTYFRRRFAADTADKFHAHAFLNKTRSEFEGEDGFRVGLAPQIEFHFLNRSSWTQLAVFELRSNG